MKTCIICIAKMENKYIEEWVNHHLNIGFDTIFICENNNSNGESISDVINNEKVVILDYKDVKGVQPIAYTETFLKFKNDYDWFAFIDCDEFIMIDEKYNNIKELLLEEIFNNADIIRLCPKVYNDNNKLDVENDDYSVLNRFQNEIKEKNQFTYFIKSLIKGSIEFNGRHIGPFGYFYNHNLHMVNSCGKKCRGINLSSQDLCFENIHINHYPTKTIGEYVRQKYFRGGANRNDLVYSNLRHFYLINEKTDEKEKYANDLIKSLTIYK